MVYPILAYFSKRTVFIPHLHDNFHSELHPFGSTVIGVIFIYVPNRLRFAVNTRCAHIIRRSPVQPLPAVCSM